MPFRRMHIAPMLLPKSLLGELNYKQEAVKISSVAGPIAMLIGYILASSIHMYRIKS